MLPTLFSFHRQRECLRAQVTFPGILSWDSNSGYSNSGAQAPQHPTSLSQSTGWMGLWPLEKGVLLPVPFSLPPALLSLPEFKPRFLSGASSLGSSSPDLPLHINIAWLSSWFHNFIPLLMNIFQLCITWRVRSKLFNSAIPDLYHLA